ncbi:MAG: T9SS type A sorting domain-containing protein, partial [Candidatus Onthomorpha sp.]
GCDSTVTLTLTVNPVATTNLTAAICEGSTYAENGFNVSEAGVYTQNLQTINGCDSTVTLTLTVNPVYNITIDATINQGDVYQENGFEVSEAGVYTQNLQSVNGCDSVIVLNLTVNSSLGDVVANSIEVALYPNPAESYTILKVQGLKEQTKVALFDLRGRKLREFDLSAGSETLRLDLRDLPSGVYTLMIGNTTKKLIVE